MRIVARQAAEFAFARPIALAQNHGRIVFQQISIGKMLLVEAGL